MELTCFVGLFKANIRLAPASLMLDGRSIATYFAEGSASLGEPAIDLTIDTVSRPDDGQVENDVVTNALSLQSALKKTVRNGTQGPVRRIGLLVADRWVGDKSALGLMFDVGFNPSSWREVPRRYRRVPREGCAIFLDAIRDLRPSDSAFSDEVTYTALHELGHVFNLWHTTNPRGFMTRSGRNGVNPERAFIPDHRQFLSRCDQSDIVWPGGRPFESRNGLGPVGDDVRNRPATTSPLKLRVSTSQKSFWAVEPVELDIELRLSEHSRRRISVPNEVDPGYERFQLWIDEPDDHRRRYRSPRRYCLNAGRLQVGYIRVSQMA